MEYCASKECIVGSTSGCPVFTSRSINCIRLWCGCIDGTADALDEVVEVVIHYSKSTVVPPPDVEKKLK